MTVDEILEHEEKLTMGRPTVYYNHSVVDYIDKHGRKQSLWCVIYEVEYPEINENTVSKRWVVHDTAGSWTGGICGG